MQRQSFHRIVSVRLAATLVLAALPASFALGSVIATDGFGDADRNNDGITEGTVTNAADVGLVWLKARATSINLPIVADPDDANGANGVEINSGNTLDYSTTAASTANRPVVANFGMQNLASGQALSASFDARIYNITTASDRGFRFGIYNSNGTPITSDQSSATLADDDRGYLARFDTDNNAAGGLIADVQYNTVQMGGGTLFSFSANSSDPSYAMNNLDKHHFVLTLTRSGNDIIASVAMDSLTIISGTHLNTASTPATTYSFDELMFTQNTSDIDFRIDNVQIEVNTVPEPASAALGCLLAGGLLARRGAAR